MTMKNEIVIDGTTYVPKGSEIQKMSPTVKGLTYCIVRTYSAGVFAGMFDRRTKGQEGTVYNARRLWYWKGATSLSEMSLDGVMNPNECKFAKPVEVDLKQIIEVLPCTDKAKASITGVKEWSQ
jgi:hypothetical protein